MASPASPPHQALLRALTLMGIAEDQDKFVRNGINTFEHLSHLSREDLRALGLQEARCDTVIRSIAITRLAAPNSPAAGRIAEGREAEPNRNEKRQYRRRPKKDPNAPVPPLTAYVVFANEYRANASDPAAFIEIARAVGKAWRSLLAKERERRERDAKLDKDRYRAEMDAYKQTKQYREYEEYLVHFKAEEQERQTRALAELSSNHMQDVDKSEGDTPPLSAIGGDTSPTAALFPSNPHGAISNVEQISKQLFDDLVSVVPFNDEETRAVQRLLQSALDRNLAGKDTSEVGELADPHKTFANRVWNFLSGEGSSSSNTDREVSLAKINDSNLSFLQQESHPRSINPFHFQPPENTLPLLQAFIDRVNPTFFFFEDTELHVNLHAAYNKGTEHSNRVMCELCFVLAIGCQWCDEDNVGAEILWYENGRRFLDDTHWDHQPWVMRSMALAGLYHLGSRTDNAQHYLHIAMRIAGANDYFTNSDNARIREVEREEWIRVWNTIVIMHSYIEITPNTSAFNLAIEELDPYMLPQPTSTPTTIDGGINHHFMFQLSALVRSVASDVLRNGNNSTATIKKHLDKLQNWSAGLPESLRSMRSNEDSDSGSLERSPMARLHLNTMLLGTTILLTSSVLLRILEGFSNKEASGAEHSDREYRVAAACVQSSYEINGLFAELVHSGLFPSKSWLSVRVAFDATLVGMLTRVWQIRLQQVGFPELLSRYKIEDDTWLHIANNGDMILKAWSDRDQTAGEYFQNLQILKQSLS